MSATAPVRPLPVRAAHAPAAKPRVAADRPQLRVVDPARLGAGPLPFALVVSAVLGAGLVALLLLHTLAAQDAFTLHKLQRQSAALGDVEQQLALADQQAQAPTALAARAKALGMVPTGSLQIVRRRDGRIVAVASAMPVPVAAPAPKSATKAPAKTAGATPAAGPAAGRPARSAHTGGASTRSPAGRHATKTSRGGH